MSRTIQILDKADTENWSTDKSVLDFDLFWAKDNDRDVPVFVYTTAPYLKQLDIEYNVSRFSDIDKSKPWFIFSAAQFPFNMNIENVGDHKMFKGLPDYVVNELVYGNAYLILSLEQEHQTNKFFELFYYLYELDSTVPANKLIHFTMAADVTQLYSEYCDKNAIAESKRMHTWFTPHALLAPVGYHSTFYKRTEAAKAKKFLNFNRVPRLHRIAFTSLLAEHDLLDCGYVSLGITDPDIISSHETFNRYVEQTPLISRIDNAGELKELIRSSSKKLIGKLPLVVDTEDFTFGPTFTYSGDLMRYYDLSYFSLVSGTGFFINDEPTRTLNEKEYKPILAKHPFILVSRPGTLALLKSLGFKTFDTWFDESYDNEQDDLKRMILLIKEVDRLCKLDDSTWLSMLSEMEETLNYNYSRIVDHVNDIIFSTDFRNIIGYAA